MSPSFLRGRKTAMCALVSLLAASLSQADTLASWNINSNATAFVGNVQAATYKDGAIASAALSLGGGVTAKNTGNTFGGDHFDYTKDVTTTFDTAKENGDYLQIGLTVANRHAITPDQLSYNIRRTGTGPSNFRWVYSIDGGTTLTTIGGEETPSTTTEAGNAYTLDLSPIGKLDAGTELQLRIVAWGAGGATGTFFFNKQGVTFTGTPEEVAGGEPIPLSISVEDFGTIYAGKNSSVALTYSGDNAQLAITADTEIAGTTNYVDGVFHFTPAAADIGKTFTFTAAVSDSTGVNQPVSDTFTATVIARPWLEDFEKAGHNSYYTAATEIEETEATWCGTNFMVNATDNDGHTGVRAAVFRAGDGYIEMTTAKENGAGSISFWHGIRANAAQSATASIVVKVSNNGGATWDAYTSDAIPVSHAFEETTLENVNVGGNVLLRFDVTCSHFASIDDILVTDYEGPVVINPAIGEIAPATVAAEDGPLQIPVVFFGDDAEGTEKTLANVSGTEGAASLENGVFTFAPTASDVGEKTFTITLSVPGHQPVSRTFAVTVTAPIRKFLRLGIDGTEREDFKSLGEDADAALPSPWRVANSSSLENFSLSYADASGATTKKPTTTSGAISGSLGAGIYNLGTNAEDRAVGFLSSSGSGSQYRTCALMVPLKNVGAPLLSKFSLSYTVEKWRNGRGKTFALYTSRDGETWTAVGGKWLLETDTDFKEDGTSTDTTAIALGDNAVLEVVGGKIELAEPLALGETIYLGWFYTSNDANSGSAQLLGIDDISIWTTRRTVITFR